MRAANQWHRYLRFWRSDVNADVDDEIAFHLDARMRELIETGVDPSTARTRAEREFGDVDRARATLRALDERHEHERHVAELFTDVWHDVRVAIRSLRQTPGFVAVIAITLALGIGLNSAVYSVVDAFLFRPLPVAHGRELVVLGQTDNALREPHEMSYPNYRDYRDNTAVFADLAATANVSASLSGSYGNARLFVQEVTANYFSVLGLTPLLGRTFAPGDDDGRFAHPLIVLTYRGWQSHFNGNPRVVGDTVRLNNRIFHVIGVTPPEFHGSVALLDFDGYVPLNQIPPGHGDLAERAMMFLSPIGRLRPGVSVERARQMVQAESKELEREYPASNRGVGVVLEPETRARPFLAIADRVPAIALAFFVLVGLVLVTACANIAALLLARASARHRERAIRAALGASAWRLVRQVFIECALLAGLGGLGAIAFATWAVRLLASTQIAADVPLRWDLRLDHRVVAFTVFVVAITAVIAAVAPALAARRANVNDALKSGARGSSGGHQRARAALVVAQLAVSAIVLVCATLFARSTRNAMKMDLGFRTDDILMASVALGEQGYDSTRGKAFFRDAMSRIASLPGVRSVAISAYTPFGYSNDIEHVYPIGSATRIPETGLGYFTNVVTPSYFTTLDVPIIAGRAFTDQDDERGRPVAVINEAFAQEVWPGQSAIGRTFRVERDGAPIEVIGVAKNAQYFMIGETVRPFYYRPLAQAYTSEMTFDVHTAGDPENAAPELRRAIAAVDPNLPMFDVRSMTEHLRGGRALLFTRIGAAFAEVFGLLALILATVGVYGVVSYSVAQQTREIGIRVALGARTGRVLASVIASGLGIAGGGVGVGLAITFFVTRLLSTLLYGVTPHDPLVFGGVASMLAVIAVLASLVPARRAARVDPLVALRAD